MNILFCADCLFPAQIERELLILQILPTPMQYEGIDAFPPHLIPINIDLDIINPCSLFWSDIVVNNQFHSTRPASEGTYGKVHHKSSFAALLYNILV